MADQIQRLLHTGADHTLVLCRTAAQAASLRRRLAAQGGVAGLSITTPDGLVAAAWPGPDPDPTEPPQSPLLARIGDRPRLLARARDLAVTVALHRHAGGSLPASARLDEIASWADHPWVASVAAPARWLVDRVRERSSEDRPGPSQAMCYDAVLHVGFEGVDADDQRWLDRWAPGAPVPTMRAWHAALMDALRARPLLPDEAATPAPIPAVGVPDPAAAARLAVAVLRAVGDPATALVLVPDDLTATRLAAAGRRNGLPVSEQEGGLLAAHGLAEPVRFACRWFDDASPDPAVRAADLDAVLTHPLVGGHLPRAAEDALKAALHALAPQDPERRVRASRSELRRAIETARIVGAPLSRWRSRLAEQAADASLGQSTRAGALKLEARLARLADCVTGAGWGAAPADLSSGEDAELVVDERVLAEEDAPLRPLPTPGTLGAARRFLVDCGLRVWSDPVGRALLAALLAEATAPASPESVAQVLDQRADTGSLHPGVEVLRYDDYDGRRADVLVLLGVHDKGLAARRTPDPLLDEGCLASMGESVGETARRAALMQAVRACARANQVLAVVAQADTSGRVVTAPIELPLDANAGRAALQRLGLDADAVALDSYGCAMPLPETTRRAVVAVVETIVSAPMPEDGPVARLAEQAHAEWCRAGRGGLPTTAPTPDHIPTLADVLDQTGPLGPDHLGIYLGELGTAPDGTWLPPDDHWSVSRHFEPLTNCMWRFFVERILKIDEKQAISDELDPRGVGNSVHGAIEAANPIGGGGVRWRVSAEALTAAQDEAVEMLRVLAGEGFSDALDELGHRDAAIDAATAGLQARWSQHWPAYARSRVQDSGTLRHAARGRMRSAITGCDGFSGALVELEGVCRSHPVAGGKLSGWLDVPGNSDRLSPWLSWAALAALDGTDLDDLDKKGLCTPPDVGSKTLTQGFDAPLREFVQAESFGLLLNEARDPIAAMRRRIPVLYQPADRVEPELPFGWNATRQPDRPGADRLAAATLTLGAHTLSVSGAIDRVLSVPGPEGDLLELLDYKTGRSVPTGSEVTRKVASLELPQLVVYALVLQDLLDGGETIGALSPGSKVAAWGYDYVRQAASKGLISGRLLDDDDVDRARDALSRLVDRVARGSVPPVPLEDRERGPSSWGYKRGPVGLRDVSRFEDLPRMAKLTDDAPSNGDEGVAP